MAGYFHVSALREEASKVFTPSCMKNIWFVFSLVSYFGSCQQPQHPAKLAPNAPVFAQRIGAGSGKGGKTPQTNRPTEYKERSDSTPKRNRMWGEGICPTGSFGVLCLWQSYSAHPRKSTQSVPRIPTTDRMGGSWVGGDQRIMEIPLHRLPIRFSFSLFVITATNRFGHAEQAAIIPFRSQVHCEGFGTWVPVSLLSKALFLFLSLSCSTRIHVKEQKFSSSSLVG